ncbi:MAG: hypothetical protein GY867_08750, partial [bacterium]|nr:hypothetical protein [bacterium]
ISEGIPEGAAYAVFSARDMVGNRGTEIDAGAVIQVDGKGPDVRSLAITPVEPVQNSQSEPAVITAIIGLNDQIAPNGAPSLSYQLSAPGRAPAEIQNITRVATMPGDAETWRAVFPLPADAGLAAPETLSFIYEGADDLGNASDKILGKNAHQIYQGELPPLPAPGGL